MPEEKYSNAFLGFGPEKSNFVVELTYSMYPRVIFTSVSACSCISLIMFSD